MPERCPLTEYESMQEWESVPVPMVCQVLCGTIMVKAFFSSNPVRAPRDDEAHCGAGLGISEVLLSKDSVSSAGRVYKRIYDCEIHDDEFAIDRGKFECPYEN